MRISGLRNSRLSHSYSSITRSSLAKDEEKLSKEEEKYLEEMNQFYLDYQEYQEKRLKYIQIKHILSVSDQASIVKRAFYNSIKWDLDYRKKRAIKILGESILDNRMIEKSLQGADMINERLNNKLQDLKKKRDEMLDFNNELEMDLDNLTIQNENKKLDNKRRSLVLDQKIKNIDIEISRTKQLIKLSSVDLVNRRPIDMTSVEEIRRQKREKNYETSIQNIINAHLLEVQQELNQKEDDIKKNELLLAEKENIYKSEYEDLNHQFQNLLNEYNEIIDLKRQSESLKNEIAQNKMLLKDLDDEYNDLYRRYSDQNYELTLIKEQLNNRKNIINSHLEKIRQRENLLRFKKIKIDSQRFHNKRMENEIDIAYKMIDLKNKTMDSLHNKIDYELGIKSSNQQISTKRYLKLDNLGIKETPSLHRGNINQAIEIQNENTNQF